jgi:outer membrane protein TolC
MHCKRLWGALILLLLLAVVGGCKQHCFMTEEDFNRTTTTLMNEMSELAPDLGEHPITKPVPPPPTLNNLDRKVRFISLAECVAIALEQGTVGQQSLLFPGQAQDNLVTGVSPAGIGSASDAIRVFALDPAAFGARVDASLSRFDAFVAGSALWQTTDQPIGTSLQTFQAGNQGLTAVNTQSAITNVGIFKPLATGGTAGIGFGTAYTFTNLPARVNPAYQPSLQFGIDQPLLQGYGVEINELRQTHPISGNILGFSNAGGNNAPALSLASAGAAYQPGAVDAIGALFGNGILISRIRFDQSRKDFERAVNQMLLNVEFAYWNLYGSYWTLYSREQGLRFAYEAFRLSKAGYEAGRVKAADFYQSRGQYELFRAQRLQALDTVLENERQLRALLGMPIEDGTRLMPSDSPTLAPFLPDWNVALQEALARRPELLMQREEVKVAQMQLIIAKNSLLPDLRAVATYDFNGLGNRLDGPDSAPVGSTPPKDINAFRSLASGNFSNWTLGVRMVMPIGYRAAYAQIRVAQLTLARRMEELNDLELKAQRFLARYYRQLSLAYETIRAQRAQREAFGEQLRARYQEFLAGRGTLDILLEAQRFWADALANEYQAIVQYNNAICGFEFAKGSIMQHDNVYISEGPLPTCAQVRAVEHERQRTAGLVLRERENPIAPAAMKPEGLLPGKAPSLPAALAANPPLKDAPAMPAAPNAPVNSLPAPVEAKIDELFPSTPAPMTKVSGKQATRRQSSEFGTSRDN